MKKQALKEKKYSLTKGIALMLEYSKDNPDIEQKTKFIAKWVRQYFKEKYG